MFPFHDQRVALPQFLAALRALGFAEDVENYEFFNLKWGAAVNLLCFHISTACLRRLHIASEQGRQREVQTATIRPRIP